MWLERACMPDDPIGCRVLGLMKVQGIGGVARDIERGKQMLKRACDAKDDEACKHLKALSEPGSPLGPLTLDDAGVAPPAATDDAMTP